MYRRQRTQSILVLFLSLFVFFSCAPSYFDPIKTPPEPLRFKGLNDLPYRELWAGIVFNGEKVGFSHLKIVPLTGEGLFRLESEAHLRIRFLGLSKGISMKSEDLVRADLTSQSFRHEIAMDDKTLIIEGSVRDGVLRTSQKSGAEENGNRDEAPGAALPCRGDQSLPRAPGHGRRPEYRYNVYDPQTQSVTAVSQTVAAFERSRELGIEPSWKVKTSMMGQDVETWINPKGEAIFELGMKGVLITYRESEAEARRYLSEASLNKKDLILDFSVVKTEKPLACPRECDSPGDFPDGDCRGAAAVAGTRPGGRAKPGRPGVDRSTGSAAIPAPPRKSPALSTVSTAIAGSCPQARSRAITPRW